MAEVVAVVTTIFGPDVSNYQGGLRIQPATVLLFAKCSEGTGYRDPTYTGFKSQAAAVGAVFMAYHFLRGGSAAAQADLAFSVVGKATPLMLDVEANGATVSDVVAFRTRYRQLGGNLRAVYLPRWYWQNIGSPSLAPLDGLLLVSSAYTPYSDSGAGWAPYGGMTPKIWQFTDSFSYGGMRVDFNAYRGTVDQLKADLGLGAAPSPNVNPAPSPAPPVPVEEDEDMPQQIDPVSEKPSGGYSYAFPKGKYREVGFLYDNGAAGGANARLRVVVWDAKGCVVSVVEVGSPNAQNHSTVVAFKEPSTAYGVDVTRLDSGPRPVGVAFVTA